MKKFKLSPAERAQYKAFIYKILEERKIDPASFDMDAFLDNPTERVTLPNGDQIEMVQIVPPEHWGAYMRTLNFFRSGFEKIYTDVVTQFMELETEMDAEKREDLAHDLLHEVFLHISILSNMTFKMMPCLQEQQGNAPSCTTIQ